MPSTALAPRTETSLAKPPASQSWDLVELTPLIDFDDLLAIVKRRLIWLIAIPAVCVAFALIYVYLFATPLYKSSALVFVDPMFDRTLQVEAVGPGISDLDSLNSLEKAIVSDSVILRVVDRLNLWNDLGFLPKSLHKYVEKGEKISSSRLLKELRDKRVSASLIRPTRLIELVVYDPDPRRAQLIATTFVDEFESFLGDQKRKEAGHSTDELRTRADQAYTRALDAEKQLENFRRENPELTVEQDHQLFAERLTRIGEELNSVSSRVFDLRSRVETLKGVDPEKDPIKVINLGKFADLDHVSDLLNQRIAAHANLAALREQITENHPRYREAQSRATEIDTQLKQLASELKSSLEADYEAAATNEKLLAERVSELQVQLNNVKAASSEFRAIQQRVETEWQVHQQLQQRIGQTELDTEKSTEITTLMSEPIVAFKPSKPNKPIAVLAGGFIGLLMGLGLVTFDLFRGRPFVNRRQVEQVLDIPVAAEIGHPEDQANDPRLMQEMTRVLLAPEYRHARFVHLSSLSPKEQDLRIAACLASASAYYSSPTLLISVVPGGDSSLPINLTPQPSRTQNLHTLRLPASCLLAQRNAWQLLSPHRQYFSRIIIESTSFAQESQIPAIVASLADANLLVVERDCGSRVEIERTVNALRRSTEAPLSLILEA
ncbi:MAG: GumC family protein [Verrucomicrobiae bacterium]|nr:GumC family protein [Verrucomicrobiae bacterium]